MLQNGPLKEPVNLLVYTVVSSPLPPSRPPTNNTTTLFATCIEAVFPQRTFIIVPPRKHTHAQPPRYFKYHFCLSVYRCTLYPRQGRSNRSPGWRDRPTTHPTPSEHPGTHARSVVLVAVQGHPVLHRDGSTRLPPVNGRFHGGGVGGVWGFVVARQLAGDYLGPWTTADRCDAHDELRRRIVLAFNLLSWWDMEMGGAMDS